MDEERHHGDSERFPRAMSVASVIDIVPQV